jgi:uncharacterized membrane protein YjgN (DUF898 family)
MADRCPKCGERAVGTDKCQSCGVIIPLYEQYLEKVRRGPQRVARGERVVSIPPAGVASGPGGSGTATVALTPPVATARPAPARPAVATRRPSFHGDGGSLFGVQIVGSLLTVVTLGIYLAWAKTKIRQYLWAQTEFEGDRLEYHGTGKELYLGMMKASLYVFTPLIVLNAIGGAIGGVVEGLISFVTGVAMIVVAPLAMVGARRYRLSRTSWRGIRFSFRGDARAFVKQFLTWSVLNVVTLGIYYPIFAARQHAFLTRHTYFGTVRFGFDGDANALVKPYLRLWGAVIAFAIVAGVLVAVMPPAAILAVLAFVLVWPWLFVDFLAKKRQYAWNHTTVAGGRFASSVTTGALFRLYAVNALLLACTLGLASAWVRVRNARFACDTVALAGAIDLDSVLQDAQQASTTGEGFASVFDTDIDIG